MVGWDGQGSHSRADSRRCNYDRATTWVCLLLFPPKINLMGGAAHLISILSVDTALCDSILELLG